MLMRCMQLAAPLVLAGGGGDCLAGGEEAAGTDGGV